VRLLCLILAVLISPSLAAQHSVKKKPAAKKQLAHKKPTPEQVRKFNELQKKQR
jgi:hypothetical protein